MKINKNNIHMHMNRYEQLALGNADLIARLESIFKSLSYMIPGRFEDSIVVSEIRTMPHVRFMGPCVVYSVLKCFKYLNDTIYYKHYRHAATTSWNNYLSFIKRLSPMASALMNILLFVRFVEVPAELMMKRFAGLQGKYCFVAVLECIKSILKGTIWWLTEYRMVPHKLQIDSIRPKANPTILFPELQMEKNDKLNDIEVRLIAMDQCCDGKTIEEKTRNFIRDNCPKPPPETFFSPAVTLLEKSRELAHICRPAVYAIFMLIAVNKGTASQKQWQLAGWLAALCMDYFSCWPEVQQVMAKTGKPNHKHDMSVEEQEEREFRLLRMGLYMFREPFFADHTKPWLDSCLDKLGGWRIMSPFVTTAKAYLALCEESSLALSELTNSLPAALRHYPSTFLQLRHDKLWHQLTVALESFAADPAALPHLPALFRDFISAAPLPALMSPFSFGRLAVKAARQLASPKEAVALLGNLRGEYEGKVQAEQRAVYLMLSVEFAHFCLLCQEPRDKLEGKRVMEEECRPIVDQLMGLAPSIMAAYYRVMAESAKVDGSSAAFYDNCVKFLKYLKAEPELCKDEQQYADAAMARDFIMSALLSPKVYDFGELLSFESILSAGQSADLMQMISVFQGGQIEAPLKCTDPMVLENGAFIGHKRQLMALSCLLTASHQRGQLVIPMATLADSLKLADVNQVEQLILDALSLDLFEGVMDECQMVLHLRAVNPRYLNMEQVASMLEGFKSYLARLDDTIARVKADLPASVNIY